MLQHGRSSRFRGNTSILPAEGWVFGLFWYFIAPHASYPLVGPVNLITTTHSFASHINFHSPALSRTACDSIQKYLYNINLLSDMTGCMTRGGQENVLGSLRGPVGLRKLIVSTSGGYRSGYPVFKISAAVGR